MIQDFFFLLTKNLVCLDDKSMKTNHPQLSFEMRIKYLKSF